MSFFYPNLAAMLVLLGFVFFVGRQHRDLLRARAYGEFAARLLPLFTAGVLALGLPFVMSYTIEGNAVLVLLTYLSGTALITTLMARAVASDERHASTLFRRAQYDEAARAYEDLVSRRPLPRYYSALGASLDASGDPEGALEAADAALRLDPELGIAYYNRASALVALGERSRARDDLQAIFRADSNRRLRQAAQEAIESLEKG